MRERKKRILKRKRGWKRLRKEEFKSVRNRSRGMRIKRGRIKRREKV